MRAEDRRAASGLRSAGCGGAGFSWSPVSGSLFAPSEQFGLTYLVIAHDLAVVRHISDRVGVMYLGALVEEADVDDLYAQPLHPYAGRCAPRRPCRTRWWRTPASGCCFHTRCPWRQATRCDEERPQLRTVELPGVPGSHRVACHWAEDIEAGKLQPREVTPQATDPTEEQGDGAVAGTANTVAELG